MTFFLLMGGKEHAPYALNVKVKRQILLYKPATILLFQPLGERRPDDKPGFDQGRDRTGGFG